MRYLYFVAEHALDRADHLLRLALALLLCAFDNHVWIVGFLASSDLGLADSLIGRALCLVYKFAPYHSPISRTDIARCMQEISPSLCCFVCCGCQDQKSGRLQASHEQQNQDDNQNDTNDADAAMTKTIAITAEPATKATKQKNHKDDG